MTDFSRLGFIGVGTMGGRMCRNLAAKSGLPVIAYDVDASRLEELSDTSVLVAASVSEIAREADVIFMCLPGEPQVEAVCFQPGGLVDSVRAGQIVVDMTTATVRVARELALCLNERSVEFADAPVAKGVPSAADGTLSIMVGATNEVYDRIEPLLRCMGEQITHCGGVGAGQTVKIMNNMVLFQTVSALAEALHIARANGVDGSLLLETLAKGSADSFALRNHAMKSLLPERFPGSAFSARYALKDNDYALDLANAAGVNAEGAKLVRRRLQQIIDAGHGDEYFPVLGRLLA